MAVLRCKMCGAPLEVKENYKFAQCRHCDSMQTLPGLDDELKLRLFERANELRRACDFDQAAGVFQSIIAQFPEEAEAYWGLVLCKYGIEYVDDPHNGKKVPTCHRTLRQSVLNDADYRSACEHADTARWKYEEEAQVIDGLQQKILSISRLEQPYDVFICYKETDDVTGARTEDSSTAQDIYTELSRDYKVFFARVSLRGKAGAEYEPYIYAALSSAKVMLVIGSKQDYFHAVWVKNEWSRYLGMMADDEKVIIPCYENIKPEQLPGELQSFQALDMKNKLFFNDLLANIRRLVSKAPTVPPTAQPASPFDDRSGVQLIKEGEYIGESIANRPNGYGTLRFPNGDLYEGCWQMGIKQGRGTYTFASGGSWTGEWKNDQPFTGTGKVVYLTNGEPNGEQYEGELVEGKKTGHGKHIFADGSCYEGDFKNNKRNGKGYFTYPSGAYYQGGYKDNKKDGSGIYVYADGARFEGQYVNGVRCGHGKYMYVSGAVYEGEYKDDKHHGQGRYTYADGSYYEGPFVDDKGCGVGKYVFSDGDVYVGEFADGKRNGQGTYTYTTGETWTGEWKDSNRWTGSGTLFYKSKGKRTGSSYIGSMLQGEYHGQGTYTYSDGKTWSGEWKNGKRWNGKGLVLLKTDGKYNGNRYEGEFRDGQYQGRGIFTFVSGNRYEGEWRNSKYHGQGTFYYQDGKKYVGEWKENELWNGKVYDATGAVEVTYIDGEKRKRLLGLF